MPSDLVVVGGGPAGCIAALKARKHGLKTVLIERAAASQFIPGETLPPALDAIWEQLGIKQRVDQAGFLRHRGRWVEHAGSAQFVPHGVGTQAFWTGAHAWRPTLRKVLLQAAAAAGVTCIYSRHRVTPLVQGGRLSGVAVNGQELPSKFVIDATGSRRWLTRHLQLKLRSCGDRRLVWYGWVRSPASAAFTEPVFSWNADGWSWTARVREDILAWNRLRFGLRSGGPVPKPAGITAYSDLHPPRAADVTWRLTEDCAGPGYFITGDAAMTLDPASSKGVLRAAMSGALAAEAIASPPRGMNESAIAAAFCQTMTSWFESETESLNLLYATVMNPAS